jgi:hypothetical protein
VFWGSETIFLDVGNEIPELVNKEAGHSYQAGDTDGEKAEAYFADVETVDWRVYQREDFEKRVIYTVREGGLWSCQLYFVYIKLISAKVKIPGYLGISRGIGI